MSDAIPELKPLQFDPSRSEYILERINQKPSLFHIVGLGRFGGNIALIKYLVSKGHQCKIFEKGSEESFSESLLQLKDFRESIQFKFNAGEFTKSPQESGLTFISPAVPPSHPSLLKIPPKECSTEVELSLRNLAEVQAKVHIVFGSVGKSTTAHLLSKGLRIGLYGNIGSSLLECKGYPRHCVMELSSFQLHYLRKSSFVPSGYIMMPLGDHHADWHGGLKAYHRAKLFWKEAWSEIIPGLCSDDRDNASYEELLSLLKIDPKSFVNHFRLLGRHNIENLECVLNYLQKIGELNQKCLNLIKEVKPLPHRLELLSSKFKGRIVNDSKSTSVQAALQALNCMDKGGVLLIGGKDKGESFEQVFELAKNKKVRICVFGQLSNCILEEEGVENYSTLDECIGSCVHELESGLDLFFSPGAPSYDQYSNYVERGEHFKALVQVRL